jgi:hypothetical protein
MKRFQAFEFLDAGWFPEPLRNFMTDYLGMAVGRLGLFAPAADVLVAGLTRTGENRIIDLGAGAGQVWSGLVPAIQASVPGVHVRLTDAYPNVESISAAVREMPGALTLESRPVDAAEVPRDLVGLRTMFLAFHHFPPAAAQRILENSVAEGQAIAIFEGQRRDVRHLIQFALSPLAVLLLTPAIRPLRLSRLFLTYVIPIVPLLVGWDGVVSVLRTYTGDEMRQLALAADPGRRFAWETGELTSGTSVVPYLLGVPQEPSQGG